jgi:hypothetical protein
VPITLPTQAMFSFKSLALIAALLASTSFSAPLEAENETGVSKRGNVLRGQWDTESELNGRYTLYNDLWGMGSASSGSQATQATSSSGTTVAWTTTWNWQGGNGQVKSCEYPSLSRYARYAITLPFLPSPPPGTGHTPLLQTP